MERRKESRVRSVFFRMFFPVLIASVLSVLFMPMLCTGRVRADEERPAVVDHAGLFTAQEEEQLTSEARRCAEKIRAELVILTVEEDTGRSGTAYAREYLLENGYGFGDGREGILFLIDMYAREYTVYEYNKEASGYLLTDYEGDRILDALESDMRGGRYAQAAQNFLEQCVYYAGVDLGENYESSDLHREPAGINWPVCLVIGLVCGAVITGILVSAHSGGEKAGAGVYMEDKGLEVKNRRDHFTHTTVVKRKIESENHSSGSGGSSGGFSGGNSRGGHGGSRSF